MLLSRGCQVHFLVSEGKTLLHVAVQATRSVTVAQLLLEARNDTNSKTGYQDTALHSAARNGHELIVSTLLVAGTEGNAMNQLGWTPLHEALADERSNVMILL